MLKPPCAFAQMDFLSAATGKAFTTVLAGFAATVTSLPNINRLPALVAGFFLVLIMTRPGRANFPALFTCAAPRAASSSMIFEHSDFFISQTEARESAMPPFPRAFPDARGFAFLAFIAFMAFIVFAAAFIAFIAAMAQTKSQKRVNSYKAEVL